MMALVELGHSSSWVSEEMRMQGPWRTRGQSFGVNSPAEAADVQEERIRVPGSLPCSPAAMLWLCQVEGRPVSW